MRVKNHEHAASHQGKPCQIVPFQGLFQIPHREDAEDNQRNHFLDRLQLRCRELIVPNPIRRHLETMLHKANPPTGKNHDPQGRVFLLEMSVPGDRHEDVGHRQQQDCLHKTSLSLVRSVIA